MPHRNPVPIATVRRRKIAIAITALLSQFLAVAYAEESGTGPLNTRQEKEKEAEAVDHEAPPAEAGKDDEAGKEEQTPRFNVLEYVVEGNSVLDPGVIQRAVYPHLGPNRRFADIEAARTSLEKVYQAAGFNTVAVDIPEQKVSGGVVRLRVTEGRLERVRVKGSRYFSLRRIRDELPALRPGAVVHMPELQEQIAALNRASPARQITPVLRAGNTPGTVALDLRVKDESPLHATLEYNNRYTANTTHHRVAGTLRYDNLWQREHSLALAYQTAPENTDEVTAVGATYVFRSDGAQNGTALYAVNSNSNLNGVGGIVTSTVGKGTIAGLRHIVGLEPRAGFLHSLSLGIDHKDFKEDVNIQGGDTLNTPIRYWPLSLAYNVTLPGANGTTTASLTANFSLLSLSAKEIDCFGQVLDQFECKRPGAKPNYFYVRGDLQRTQNISGGFTVVGRAGLQWTADPLISNEQYTAGGLQSVRGYLESERFGDSGWQGSLELRTPSLTTGKSAKSAIDVYGLGFIEGAGMYLLEPLVDQESSFSLLSTGIGLRFAAGRWLNAELHWAKALRAGSITLDGDQRVHFRMEATF